MSIVYHTVPVLPKMVHSCQGEWGPRGLVIPQVLWRADDFMLRRKQINLITYAPASLTLPHMGHLGQLLGRDVPAYSVNWNQPFKVYHIFTDPTWDSSDVNAPLGEGV